MEAIKFEKVRDGKYLKNYEITYKNKAGREKKYEIVSRRDLKDINDVGQAPSGVSIVATKGDRLLLLHEFRMGVNRTIYNLCAGMLEKDETIEACIARELSEETGLKVKAIKKILPPSYAAVAISDTTTYIAFVEAEGEISGGHARALLSLEDGDAQYAAAEKILEHKLSVRETEKLVKTMLRPRTGSRRAPLDPGAELVYRDMENRIREILGTKVSISRKDENRGKIEIEYYSVDELERLMDLFRDLKK